MLTASNVGIFASSINMDKLEITNYELIDFTKSNYTLNSRLFYKHPEEDIIFVAGYNFQIQAIKVESFQNSKYILMMDTYLSTNLPNIYLLDILFVYKQNMPKLLISSFDNLYQLDISIDLVSAKINPLNNMNPLKIDFVSNMYLYNIEGTSQIIGFPGQNITIYDYQTGQISYRLCIFIFNYFQLKPQSLSTKDFQFSWDQVGNNLDPFYFQDNIWVVLSFPDKSQIQFSQNGLFYLINSQNSRQFYVLASPDSTDNKQNTAFALASLYDSNNPEIIGVDQNGKVYIWNLLSLQLNLKSSFQLIGPLNPFIGEIYQDQKAKKLLIVCQGSLLQSYDLNSQNVQLLKELSSNPQSIRSFPSIKMIAIPDYYGGTAYLYKYNPASNQFDLFLQLFNGQIVDNLIYIELLSDNKLWLQYQFSHLFYPLQNCLEDVYSFKNCTATYYFNVNNTQDQLGSFGQGTAVSPFTTAENFYQSILNFLRTNDGILDKGNIILKNFRSGDTLDNITFMLMSDQQKIMYPVIQQEYQTFNVQVKIKSENPQSFQLRGDQVAFYNKELKLFQFNQLTIVGIPGSNATLQFYSNQIFNLDAKTNYYSRITHSIFRFVLDSVKVESKQNNT
ncbi:hypothetical protein ABPG72_009209 [Tetrahymena utriculariae]